MVSLLQTYLLNAIGLSVIGISFMILIPFLSRRYSAKCLYYIWFVVIAALLFPVRPQFQINIPEKFQSLIPLAYTEHIQNAVSVNGNATSISMWWQVAAVIWVIGGVCFLGWHIFHHLKFVVAVKRWSNAIESDDIYKEFNTIKNELGIKQKIQISSCECIKSPMMVGMFKPVILIPRNVLTQDELPLILRHELIHYKRKDLWFKILTLLALSVHWYNPIVHLMCKSVLNLCEISCDEEALKNIDIKKRARYGEAIIAVIQQDAPYKTALSTNFYSSTKGIKKRIFAIMDTKRKHFSPLIFIIVAAFTLCGISAFAMTIQPDENVNTKHPISATSSQNATKDSQQVNESASNQNKIVATDNSPQIVKSAEGQNDILLTSQTNSTLIPN